MADHTYQLNKTRSKEDDVGGPTLLELQRSSAVISQSRGDKQTAAEKLALAENLIVPEKRLLWMAKFDQRVIDLLYWKSTTKSLLVFAWTITVLIILRSNSVVYVFTASLMSLLVVMACYVGLSILLQAATTSTAFHPFYRTLSRDITLSKQTQTAISDVVISLINASLDFISRIVLVQSFGVTFRALMLVWVVWAYVDDTNLVLILATCTVFLVPKFYHSYTDTCETLIEVFETNTATGLLTSQFVLPDDESDFSDASEGSDTIVSQIKDILTASIVGVLIVGVVKYLGTDQEGELPNLFMYLRSVYWSDEPPTTK